MVLMFLFSWLLLEEMCPVKRGRAWSFLVDNAYHIEKTLIRPKGEREPLCSWVVLFRLRFVLNHCPPPSPVSYYLATEGLWVQCMITLAISMHLFEKSGR